MKLISYTLADADWHYLHDVVNDEYRFDTQEEAQRNIEDASLTTDLPQDQIVILMETRENIN